MSSRAQVPEEALLKKKTTTTTSSDMARVVDIGIPLLMSDAEDSEENADL